MELKTTLNLTPSHTSVSYPASFVTIGSCFALAMGKRLKNFKHKVLQNPFGTIYNPISIHELLIFALSGERPDEATYLRRDGIYFNYLVHSEVSHPSEKKLREAIDERLLETKTALETAEVLMMTYGTALAYRYRDAIVSNCHKMPASMFTRDVLSADSITESFEKFLRLVKDANPNLRIIVTVSPVRHLKDTIELNAVSKSILRVACHQIINRCAGVEYFPAYEFMMDDLRDYRFYQQDMIHPTEQAEEYIWEKFSDRYFSLETRNLMKEWSRVCSALAHKPFHPATAAHRRFLETLLEQLTQLGDKVDTREEIISVKKQLEVLDSIQE